MTRYEQELRKLFENTNLVDRPQYSGRICVGELGKDLRVRAEFFSAHAAKHYDAIRLTVLNRTAGVVDQTLLHFKDVWGMKDASGNPNFQNMMVPYLWDDNRNVDWYVYYPNAADYAALRQAMGQYLSMFRERTPEQEQTGSKLVYICAPLRGDVKENIEFARQKAQEVFADGDIPICPHLLFPPIADPNHPEQDAVPALQKKGAITLEQEHKKPSCPLIGQNGNIFNLIVLASRTLRQNGMANEAKEMQSRIMGGNCHSYEEALGIISEYVETELSGSILTQNKKKENHAHER